MPSGSPGGTEPAALRALEGKPAIYHCISRVVDRKFVLGEEEKEQFAHYLRTYEAFGHLRVLTYCIMSNHFHILVEVPERPAVDPEDGELLEHLRVLYSGKRWREIQWQLQHFREQGNHAGAEQLRQRFLSRMWDLSAFMKALKQRFSQWHNKRRERDGCLWSERFKSVLVEDGHAARVMAAYIDLNPVRAGIVKRPEDYRWSGYGEATAGRSKAREGLKWLMFERARMTVPTSDAAASVGTWRETAAQYRGLMESDAKRNVEGKTSGTENPREQSERRMKGRESGNYRRRLSERELLHRRVRYFSDGLVIGTKMFLDRTFALTRERFGPHRRTGARKLAGANTALHTMRELKLRAYGAHESLRA